MGREGRLKAVITQNIDGLHQRRAAVRCWSLHGSVLRNYCTRCGKFHDLDFILRTTGVPRCECGGVVKPDVVLYEESLNEDVMARAIHYIRQADVLLIGGTSLVVYPRGGPGAVLPGQQAGGGEQGRYRRGSAAAVTVDGPIGQTLAQL